MTPAGMRQFAAVQYFLLIALQLLWQVFWVPPTQIPLLTALALSIVPLIPGALAIALGAKSALVWAGMVVLGYFGFAAMEFYLAGPARAPALLQCVICVLYFLALYYSIIGEKRIAKLAKT